MSTEATTLVPLKPRARRVAISVPRTLTAEYIVFSALNIAPTAMMAPISQAMSSSRRFRGCDCEANIPAHGAPRCSDAGIGGQRAC